MSGVFGWFLAIISAGGGGAIVAFAAFRWLGSTWLESKFAQSLEAFRHEKAKDLERLRFEMDALQKGKARFKEREFESIIQIWDALKQAQVKVTALLSPLQQYGNVRYMEEGDLAEYFESLSLKNWERREIIAADDRQKAFMKVMDQRRFSEAAEAYNEFSNLLIRFEILISVDVVARLKEIRDKFHEALVSKELALAHSDWKLGSEAWLKYDKECLPLITDLTEKARKSIANDLSL